MAEYHHRGHRVTNLKYHLIWVTKYRFTVLKGDGAVRCRDLLRQICQAREGSIGRGAVSPDHVPLLVSAPPLLAPAKLVQYLKGSSSRRWQEEFPALRKRYWGQPLWARGYFCATVGAVDEKTIKRDIEEQKWERRRGRAVSRGQWQGGGGRRAFKRPSAAPWTSSPTPSYRLQPVVVELVVPAFFLTICAQSSRWAKSASPVTTPRPSRVWRAKRRPPPVRLPVPARSAPG